ncbi:MAG: hypothetical protein ACI4QR_03540, partial [Eubacteriales bacterium]
LINKITDGYSPDVLMLSSNDKRTGIDAVRSFVSSVYLTPNELDFKMYIFDKADKLTPQAQNALLKIIEEPPKNIYIFLLCENAAALLQTVRSRVITVKMQIFSPEQLRRYLSRDASLSSGLSDGERTDFALRMSGGAIGAVKNLLDEESGEYEAYKKASEIIDALSMKNRATTYFDFLNLVIGFADSAEKLSLLLKYLILDYEDVLSFQNSDMPDIRILSEKELEKYASVFSVRTSLGVLEILCEVKKNMNFNSNLGTSCVYLAENLWRRT